MDAPKSATAAATVHPEERALTHGVSHARFWIPAAGFLALDLWSKSAAFSRLSPEGGYTVIPGLLEFRRSLNDGAVFGSFNGYTSMFMLASVLALLFVFFIFASSHRAHRVLHVALSMILAGALGNLYDRAFVEVDVAVRVTEAGEERFIGMITDDSEEDFLLMGHWPEGAPERRFLREGLELRHQGVVRDFLHFLPHFPEWVPKVGGKEVWPWVFNVADAALVVGVILLLLSSWLDKVPGSAPAE